MTNPLISILNLALLVLPIQLALWNCLQGTSHPYWQQEVCSPPFLQSPTYSYQVLHLLNNYPETALWENQQIDYYILLIGFSVSGLRIGTSPCPVRNRVVQANEAPSMHARYPGSTWNHASPLVHGKTTLHGAGPWHLKGWISLSSVGT